MGSSRALALAFALACAASPAAAHADPSEAEKESARTLMDEGDKRIEARDLEGALRAYQAADGIMHVPTTSVEVAKTLALMRRLVAARDAALAATRFPYGAGEPPPFTQARQEASALLVLLGGAIATVRVEARGADPEKVLLHVDGEVRSAAESIELDPGRHVFVVAAAGFADGRREVVLGDGQRTAVVVELTPLARRAPTTVVPPKPGLSPLVPVGFGVAAAGLAVGATFGALSIARTNQLDDRCDAARTCPESAAQDLEAAETLANVSNVGFGLAVAGVVAGVVGLVVSSRRTPAVRAGARSASIRVWFE